MAASEESEKFEESAEEEKELLTSSEPETSSGVPASSAGNDALAFFKDKWVTTLDFALLLLRIQ